MYSGFRDGIDIGDGIIAIIGINGLRLIDTKTDDFIMLDGLDIKNDPLIKNERLFNITADTINRQLYLRS